MLSPCTQYIHSSSPCFLFVLPGLVLISPYVPDSLFSKTLLQQWYGSMWASVVCEGQNAYQEGEGEESWDQKQRESGMQSVKTQTVS